MQRLAIKFLDQGLHRVVFDAMPIPVFVVDNEVSILDYNPAAAKVLKSATRQGLGKRAGDILQCLHATESPEGCGHGPRCQQCVVRQSVRSAFNGHSVVRRPARLHLLSGGKPRNVSVKVTCEPFTHQGLKLTLVILEGLERESLFSRNRLRG